MFNFSVVIDSGVGPYTYSWSNGATTANTSISFFVNASDEIDQPISCTVTDLGSGQSIGIGSEAIGYGF